MRLKSPCARWSRAAAFLASAAAAFRAVDARILLLLVLLAMVCFVCGVLFIISRAASAAASHAASAVTTRSESARPRIVIVGRGARVAGRQRLLLAAQLLWRHCCIGTAAAQCTGGCCNGFGQRWNVHGRSRQLSRATVTAVIKRWYGHTLRCFYAAGCVAVSFTATSAAADDARWHPRFSGALAASFPL